MSKAPPGIREVPFHSQKALLYMYPTVHLTHKQASRGKTNSLAPPFFSFLKHIDYDFLMRHICPSPLRYQDTFLSFFFRKKREKLKYLIMGPLSSVPILLSAPRKKSMLVLGGD